MAMRTCGECQLCCKLVPVRELDKPAGQRCQFQRHAKGCSIYRRRPMTCSLWSCRWLNGADTADLRRPDRSRYVIDCMPEFIRVLDHRTGQQSSIPCIQIWVDPRTPDAHRDQALRAYLERRSKEGYVGLARFSAREALVLVPPLMASDGQWHEERGAAEGEHSAAEVAEALATHGLTPLGDARTKEAADRAAH